MAAKIDYPGQSAEVVEVVEVAILAKAAPVVRRCKVAETAETGEVDSGVRHCMVMNQGSLSVEVVAEEDCLVESWLNASFLIRIVIFGNG
ncbi:hypothetical protein [uncultured Varibaculum sp.]|uniref:hypothetical protein n=1 Tax=uncultured Varibaculum sp. TaxID=413896 RepID=UPI0026744C0B|nr:hypothetical protein [uncultured Varibaculum sp.]